MPLYDFKCSENHKFERMVKLVDFEVPQKCACGAPAIRLISTPRFSVDKVDYLCPITGKSIRSKHQHEENLKVQDCRVLETGERESNVKAKAAIDEAFEKSLDETVEREIDQMSSEKREQLGKELGAGVDIAVERV